jgi:hypothetical protein
MLQKNVLFAMEPDILMAEFVKFAEGRVMYSLPSLQ